MAGSKADSVSFTFLVILVIVLSDLTSSLENFGCKDAETKTKERRRQLTSSSLSVSSVVINQTKFLILILLIETGKAASVGIRGSRKNQALSRKSTAAKKKGFRINGRLKGKKTVKAKWIPKDVRQGNPFANLPVIKDDDLRDGVYTLVNQGFIPKEVDVEPILARDQGILNIKKAR